MEQELITVIIPVYKVEPYLTKCVESVLAQTYVNLQIILVDDGSPDGCPALCDELAERDERITVIHQKNGGLSAARNAGLDIAAGRYIAFVDSDDYIAPEMFQTLHMALTDTGADLCVCDYLCVDGEGNRVKELTALPRAVMAPEEVYTQLEKPVYEWRFVTAVNRLYKKELFDGLRFAVGKLYEDEFLAPHVLAKCGSVAVIPDVLYYYVQRSDSIMGAPVTIRRLDAVQAVMERYDFYRARGLKTLAASALERAYGYLWQVITKLDAWKYRKEIKYYVNLVLGAQLRALNPSAVLLALRYVYETVRHMGGAR